MTESKVTAAAVASAVVPLIMLLATVFNWGITEEGAQQVVLATATVVIPALTWIVGYFKRSRTSAVSSGFHPTTAAEALHDQGFEAAATRLRGVPAQGT